MQAKNTNSPFAISFVRSAPTTKNETNKSTNIQSTAREFWMKSGVDLIFFAILKANLFNSELFFRKLSSLLDESDSGYFPRSGYAFSLQYHIPYRLWTKIAFSINKTNVLYITA